ncbi:Microperfuranone synthase [Cladobotryum mycophilum]|uniref:Microperfuranone synthase n=1 Tax=Cladobotryum mycophilum TaxID=491253 RepID=A0ABR0T265_9HYPO
MAPLTPDPESIQNLSELLTRASVTQSRLTFYQESLEVVSATYAQLLRDAKVKARLLRCIEGVSPSSIVLLHFNSQYENIQWFWAAILAGVVPAISTPFVHDHNQRGKHLAHLNGMLNKPIILTTKRLIPEFLYIEGLRIYGVEDLESDATHITPNDFTPFERKGKDTAVLMLTSGSTGNAKAVQLRHSQIVRTIQGKSQCHGTQPGDTFLNWIGLDHVASLTEIHLHAMYLCCNQIHVASSVLLQDPLKFVQLLSEHTVAYTFAPNFFLNSVRDSVIAAGSSFHADLSHLRSLISGGESTVVATCTALTEALCRFGLQKEIIRPGFGMTETCAGAIYSKGCPSYDISCGYKVANLGTCIPGLEMRILNSRGSLASAGETGDLQISGPILFDGYFNNPGATKDTFTEDGWFITGDLAFIDKNGNLNLTGRSKDTIIVNGVKWSSTDIETAIEEEGIPGLIPSYTVAFSHKAPHSPTEDICIVYSPSYPPEDDQTRFETAAAISKTVSLIIGKRPDHLIPLPPALLQKSSLGKISRTKVRTAFENLEYASFESENSAALAHYREARFQPPTTKTETAVQTTLAKLLTMSPSCISMNASIFDLGVDSFNLFTLRRLVEAALGSEIDIPMSFLLIEPTVGAISASIDTLQLKPQEYNPIVPLQPHGSKTPLFCIHPGCGDILVFITLAAQFSTRPVYAIRARGHNPNERFFTSIQEAANTYAEHIRKTQPEGPYAIAGYSLGSTLAYEVGKVLEAQGQEVKFLASIDYPLTFGPMSNTWIGSMFW